MTLKHRLFLAAIALLPLRIMAEQQPAGMVYIRAGDFWMGSQAEDLPDALPVHRVHVDGFWMDRTDVTNAQFAAFVKATGYVTLAERRSKLQPGGAVFSQPETSVSLEDATAWWSWVPGANWRHPDGPNSDIHGKDDVPVVQIAWEDAVAFAQWAHKRLPTEAEWDSRPRGPGPSKLCLGTGTETGRPLASQRLSGKFSCRQQPCRRLHRPLARAFIPAECIRPL